MSATTPRAHRSPMTAPTLRARAIQRAFDEHVHVLAVPGLPGCYVTKSKTDPTVRHTLVADPDGTIGCSCRGFAYRQSCKHAEALRIRLAREATTRSRNSSGPHS
jgi:hypothetical protein